MITRRTLRRTHLLRPDPQLTNLFAYVLAVVAARHRIQVHAVVVMSTHEHIVLTDPHARLPRFLQELHRLLALGVKVLRKWEGAVWDHEKTSVVELCTPAARDRSLCAVKSGGTEAATRLLSLYNDEWRNDDATPKNAAEFVACLGIDSITGYPDGSLEVSFTDGELFAGHLILVGVEDGAVSDVSIAG